MLISDSLPTCVVVFDDLGGVIYANARARLLLGPERKAQPMLGLPAEHSFANSVTFELDATSGGIARRFEVRPIEWEGKPAWCAAERAVYHEKSALYRSVFDCTADGVFVANEAGFYIDVNTAALRMMQCERDQLVGKHLSQFIDPTDIAKRPPEYSRLTAGHPIFSERRMRRPDGSVFPSRIGASRLPNGWVLGVVRDLTDESRNAAALQQAARLDAVGKLAGGVAHDFNNLLTVINSIGSALEHEVQGAEAAELIGELNETTARGAVLIRQLLAFSQVRPAQPQSVKIDQLTQGFASLLRRVITRDVELVLELNASTAKVRIDPLHYEQVLLNLLINARDAMPTGGQVRVRTELVDGALVVSIIDQGHGFDDETRARLFEPFFTTRPGRSAGLGLVTTQRIVQGAGGTISATSSPGKGATFRITLPLERTITAGLELPTRKTPRHVLLLDDDEMVRRALTRVLTVAEAVVQPCSSAQEAEALILSNTPIDVLVTDVMLKGVDGFELVKRWREERPELKAVFITGDVTRTAPPGDEILHKPFGTEKLLAAIERQCAGQKKG